MRWLLALLFMFSVLHVACGRTELDLPGVDVSCQAEATCPPGLTCISGHCVLPAENPSAGTGGGGGSGYQIPGDSTAGSWGGTQEPTGGGAAGSTSSPQTSSGGRGPVPAGSPAGAGAMAGMPGPGGSAAGNPASRSSSVGGQPRPAGTSTGGRLSVAGTTSIVGGSGGASRASSWSSRPNGEVTFYSGQAQGRLMTGYAWVAMGKDDSMTSPTCDTGKPITNAMACTTETKWSTLNSLCMSGSIPALPAVPLQSDYDNNWGMKIGVNATEPSDAAGPAMSSFSTVAFYYSGIPKTGVRAFIHRKGDPEATTYCVDSIASGRPFSVTKFNTRCWGEPTTVFLTLTDLPSIDKIGIMVSSTTAEITVSSLCLERIVFN